MSQVKTTQQDDALLDVCEDFLSAYYREEIVALANEYPSEKALWIDYNELWRCNPDLADDLRADPEKILEHLEAAVQWVDVPVGVSLEGVSVRVTNLPEGHTVAPGELRASHAGKLVAIHGVLERCTTSSDAASSVVFECQRCTAQQEIPQSLHTGELQEPHDCMGCDRQGPFEIKHQAGEWADYAKLRIESRPDVDEGDKGNVTAYVMDDLLDTGGDQGIVGRVGEPVTVTGIVERVQKSGRGENELLFDHTINVRGVEFPRDADTVNVAEHREAFEELAAREDAIDIFAASIAPNLHGTDAWEAAFEFAVAYLFGAPRIDIHNGPTYRGDLHFLIISDYGMGKSTFKTDVEAYSPKCISKSTTALSSGVGLTAAAIQDDFGEGQWTIKPGLLVRANGGHLILDEIDKGPEELTEMNDAIEGEQLVDVEKAGMSVTYESRTALMALGNPVEGRFEPKQNIAHQMGIDETLLSRFDGIVTMSDEVDETQDRKIAETWGRAYTEAQEAAFGEKEGFDQLERDVPVEVGRAWVKYARENVNPRLTLEQFRELEDWYADEVRQLNKDFAGDGEGSDMPVPATVRVLPAAVKMSIAFARAELRDEVSAENVARAKTLGKKLIKNNWDGEQFDGAKNQKPVQGDKITKVKKAIRGTPDIGMDEIIERTGLDRSSAEYQVQKLKNRGDIYEPQTGEFRTA